MINQRSIDAVRASRVTPTHVRPLYDSYSFANIPGSICRWLTGDPSISDRALPADVLGSLPTQYDKVVLVVIDALGWTFVEPLLRSDPFLRRFAESEANRGVASVLTSQFPSTTSAHMTTLHSGQPVGETGVFEWFYYEPLVDRVIAPLLYARATDTGRDTLNPATAPPDKLYPTRSVYDSLSARGIHLYAHMNHTLTESVYTKTMLKGSTIIPSLSYSGAFVDLAHTLAADPAPAFHFVYESIIDTMLHVYGPGAPQVQAEIGTLLCALENVLHGALAKSGRKTLLLVTADHGQIDNNLAETFYLDQHDPGLVDLLRKDKRGEPIVPGGSSRDMFLYVQPERIVEAQARLIKLLGDKAEVRLTSDLIAEGYFGTRTPSPEFMSRVSELVILPRPGQLVYWDGGGRFTQKYRGMHGGLTPQEMEIPFLALSYP